MRVMRNSDEVPESNGRHGGQGEKQPISVAPLFYYRYQKTRYEDICQPDYHDHEDRDVTLTPCRALPVFSPRVAVVVIRFRCTLVDVGLSRTIQVSAAAFGD